MEKILDINNEELEKRLNSNIEQIKKINRAPRISTDNEIQEKIDIENFDKKAILMGEIVRDAFVLKGFGYMRNLIFEIEDDYKSFIFENYERLETKDNFFNNLTDKIKTRLESSFLEKEDIN